MADPGRAGVHKVGGRGGGGGGGGREGIGFDNPTYSGASPSRPLTPKPTAPPRTRKNKEKSHAAQQTGVFQPEQGTVNISANPQGVTYYNNQSYQLGHNTQWEPDQGRFSHERRLEEQQWVNPGQPIVTSTYPQQPIGQGYPATQPQLPYPQDGHGGMPMPLVYPEHGQVNVPSSHGTAGYSGYPQTLYPQQDHRNMPSPQIRPVVPGPPGFTDQYYQHSQQGYPAHQDHGRVPSSQAVPGTHEQPYFKPRYPPEIPTNQFLPALHYPGGSYTKHPQGEKPPPHSHQPTTRPDATGHTVTTTGLKLENIPFMDAAVGENAQEATSTGSEVKETADRMSASGEQAVIASLQKKIDEHLKEYEIKTQKLDEWIKSSSDFLSQDNVDHNIEGYMSVLKEIPQECKQRHDDLLQLEELSEDIIQMIEQTKGGSAEANTSTHELKTRLESKNRDLYQNNNGIKEYAQTRQRELEQRRVSEFKAYCREFVSKLRDIQPQQATEGNIKKWYDEIVQRAKLLQQELGMTDELKTVLQQVVKSYAAVQIQKKTTDDCKEKREADHQPEGNGKGMKHGKENETFETLQLLEQNPGIKTQTDSAQFFNQADVLEKWTSTAMTHISGADLGNDVEGTRRLLDHTQKLQNLTTEKIQNDFEQLVATAKAIKTKIEAAVHELNDAARVGDAQGLVNQLQVTDTFSGQGWIIRKGEIVTLINTKESKPGCWTVQCEDGQSYYLPKDFLEAWPVTKTSKTAGTASQLEKLEKVEKKLQSIKQKMEEVSKGLEEREAYVSFLQQCSQLEKLINENLGLRNRREMWQLKTKINDQADDLRETGYGKEADEKRQHLNQRCDWVKQALKENMDFDNLGRSGVETGEGDASANTDENLPPKGDTEALQYPKSWGSVTVYVVHTDGCGEPKNYDISDKFDACLIQFALIRKNQIPVLKEKKVILKISLQNCCIQCDMSGADKLKDSEIEKLLVSAFKEILRGIEIYYLRNEPPMDIALKKAQAVQIRDSIKQNSVEVYDCGTKGKCLVGQKNDVEQFWKDIGIEYDRIETCKESGPAYAQKSFKINTKTEDDKGEKEQATKNPVLMADTAGSTYGKQHKGDEPSQKNEESLKTGKTLHFSQTKTDQVNKTEHTAAIVNANIAESAFDKGQPFDEPSKENEEMLKADEKNQDSLGDKDQVKQTEKTVSMASANIAKNACENEQNVDEPSKGKGGNQTEKLHAWKKSIIGLMPTGKEKDLVWCDFTEQLDPCKLQFAITNESSTYTKYYTDILKEEGFIVSVREKGVVCKMKVSMCNTSIEEQKNHALQILQTKVADCIGVRLVQNESKQHQALLNKQFIPIKAKDVAVLHGRHDDLYLVGDIDELKSFWKDLEDEAYSSSSVPEEKAEDKNIVYQSGWSSVTFTVQLGSSKQVQLKSPTSLDLALLQFALTCQEQLVREGFRKQKVDFKVINRDESSVFVLDGPVCTDIKGMEDIIRTVFEEIFAQFEKSFFEDGTVQSRKLLDGMNKGIPPEIKNKLVALFNYCKDKTICIVGKIGKVKKVFDKFGITFKEGTHCFNFRQETIILLQQLDIEDFWKEKKAATLLFGASTIKLQAETGNLNAVKTELKKLIDNVFFGKISFSHPECEKLLSTNGGINHSVVQYFKEELQRKFISKKNVALNVPFTFRINNEAVELVCRNKASFDAVETHVQTRIVRMNTVIKTKSGLGILEKGQEANKVRVLVNRDNLYEFVCTYDIYAEMKAAEERYQKEFKLPKLVVSFLQTHYQTMLRSLAEETHVQVSLHSEYLTIDGNQANIMAFEKQFKQSISMLRKSVPVLDNAVSIDEAELTDVVGKYGCFTKQLSSQSEKLLKNCTYLATWFSPIDSCRLTVVEGNLSQANPDVIIILVNDSLCTVRSVPGIDEGHVFEQGCDVAKKVKRNFKLGEVHFRFIAKGSKRLAASIVAFCGNGHEIHTISTTMLQDKITQIIEQAVEQKAQTVLMDSGCFKDQLDTATLIEAAAAGTKNYFLTSKTAKLKLKEFFISCETKTAKDVMKQVHKCFKKHSAYGRKVYPGAMDLLKKTNGTPLSVKVKVKSILDIKADIIVNSTQCTLDLSDGIVSKQILEHAGKEVQEALKKNYPDKITYGQVAVTPSYGLAQKGKRFIFHAALPRKNVTPETDWKEGVKQFVKVCLYQANASDGKSIAFPALGVGNLHYPWRDSAQAMFDAVKEFEEEVVTLNLECVKIALYSGDPRSCDVFVNEAWRRSKKFEKELGEAPFSTTGYPVLTLTSKLRPRVYVCQQEYIARMSDALQIFFGLKALPDQKREPGTYFKSASQPPKSMYDSVTVVLEGNNGPAFMKGIEWCWESCLEQRATEAIIYTSDNLQFPHGRQVQTLVGMLRKRQKETNVVQYLRNIFIAVPDVSAFQNVSDTLLSDQRSMWETINFQDDENVDVTVELIGKSPEMAAKAEYELKQFLKVYKGKKDPKAPNKPVESTSQRRPAGAISDTNSDYESKGAKPKDSNTAYGMVSDKHNPSRQIQKSDVSEKDDGCIDYEQILGKVSAILNPGIIAYKQQCAELESWTSNIEKHFGVQISATKDECVEVTGSLDAVARFQEYLDNCFPEDPKEIALDNATAIKEELHCLSTTVGTSTDSIYQFGRDKMMKYKFGNIDVELLDGNLINQNVDCIAISNQKTMLNRHGLAKSVADSAGQEYKIECEKSGKRELKVTECRITTSGNLKCKAVAHVCVPTFNLKKQQESLVDLEMALINCFKEVDKRQLKSLALPCIGSGSSKFPIRLCAQQYVRALDSLRSSRNCLRKVVFVDLNGTCMENLHNQFMNIPDVVVQQIDQTDFDSVTSLDMLETDVDSGLPMKHLGSAKTQQSNNTDVKYWELKTSKSAIKVYVCKADVTAIRIGAAVCPEYKDFKGEGQIARNFKKLGGDKYRQACTNLFQYRSNVVATPSYGGSIQCNYVMHITSPRWSRTYCQNAGTFQADMKSVLRELFHETHKLQQCSIAIPLLGTGDERENMLTPLETCCSSMIDGIQDWFENNSNLHIKRIDICCLDDTILRAFNNEIEHRNVWRGIKNGG